MSVLILSATIHGENNSKDVFLSLICIVCLNQLEGDLYEIIIQPKYAEYLAQLVGDNTLKKVTATIPPNLIEAIRTGRELY